MRAKRLSHHTLTRLFTITTRVEAFCVIYALATGAAQRGSAYLARFPGPGGWLLYGACMISVLMAGAKILDCLKYEAKPATPASKG